MESLLFFLIMVPCAALFTGIGLFAWRRKKPMWFYAGSEVKPWQIRDIPAYNRANGIMWILFSLGFWAAAIAGFWSPSLGGILTAATCFLGIPALLFAYRQIYRKYKA